jgi:hypothetical protein
MTQTVILGCCANGLLKMYILNQLGFYGFARCRPELDVWYYFIKERNFNYVLVSYCNTHILLVPRSRRLNGMVLS